MIEPTSALANEKRLHLLCYLVVAALASYSLTRRWRLEHLVESTRIWLVKNGATAAWMDRVLLGQLALKLAQSNVAESKVVVRQRDVAKLFTDNLALNWESPVVGRLWAICAEALHCDPGGSSATDRAMSRTRR